MASYMLVPLNKVFLFTNCDELHSHTRLPLLVFLLMSAPSSASDFCWVRPAKGWWKNNPPPPPSLLEVGGVLSWSGRSSSTNPGAPVLQRQPNIGFTDWD